VNINDLHIVSGTGELQADNNFDMLIF